MPRFFVDYLPSENKIKLNGEDARHISKSLRMTVGEGLTVCDGKGTDYSCEIAEINRDEVLVSVLKKSPSQSESPLFITLYQGLPKSDKMDVIIQKAVELGVSSIVPVLTARCISRPDQKSMENKIKRWNVISRQAAQQSGRGRIPLVADLMTLQEAVRLAQGQEACVLYEAEQVSARVYVEQLTEKCAFFVGPEGGFEEDEIQLFKSQGILSLSLGRRIMRCETAGAAFLAMLTYSKEL